MPDLQSDLTRPPSPPKKKNLSRDMYKAATRRHSFQIKAAMCIRGSIWRPLLNSLEPSVRGACVHGMGEEAVPFRREREATNGGHGSKARVCSSWGRGRERRPMDDHFLYIIRVYNPQAIFKGLRLAEPVHGQH